jgi:DNA-binding transcriptional MerR regulator
MADEPSLSIGKLARAAGVNRETLRYYERLGLLPPDERTAAGYRLYGSRGAERLRFIKRAQGFGFSLEEIRELLSLRPQSAKSCDRVMAMLDRKLSELETELAEMRRFHRELSRYRVRCAEALEEGADCPLIVDVSRPEKKRAPGA